MYSNNDAKASNTKTNNHNKTTSKPVNDAQTLKRPASKRKSNLSNSKLNKKKKKKRKKKVESNKIDHQTKNNKETMNGLHKTHTSPINSLKSLMAQLSNVSDVMDDNKDKDPPNEHRTSIKTTDLPSTETKYDETATEITKNKNRKSKPNRKDFASLILEQQHTDADAISLQYFHNYFDRNNRKPTEINTLLDRIERDLQFIFNDNFLSKSATLHTEKLYTLIISLHKAFIEYNLSFLLPVCNVKLIELDTMFLSIIKYLNRFKRYHRSPQIAKYKQQINKLKNNVAVLINNIESNCCIILYALIRTKQLFLEFHKNSKLLMFWMELFPKEELEFVNLSWTQFVHSVQSNKSLKKFKTLPAEEMINGLTQNYEVLSIQQFLKYVSEYDSVGAWLNDMYQNLSEQISNAQSSNVGLTETINQNVANITLAAQGSVIIHEEEDDDVASDDGTINTIDGIRPSFDKFNSNGTVITSNYSTYSTSAALPLSRTSSSSSGMVIECEREELNKTIKSLQAEMSKMQTENYEYTAKIKEYELRLNAGKLQSKEFFDLQSKFQNHEKLSILLKKRCFSSHQQTNRDLTQFTQHLQNDNNCDSINSKISEIQNSLSNIKKNAVEKTKIKTTCKDILAEHAESQKMCKKVCKSLEFASSEIYHMYQELNYLTEQQQYSDYKKVCFQEATLSAPNHNKMPQTPPTPEPHDYGTPKASLSPRTHPHIIPNISLTAQELEMSLFTRPRPKTITFGHGNNKNHSRHQSYSVTALKEKMTANPQFNTPPAMYNNFVTPHPQTRPRPVSARTRSTTHFRTYTSANKTNTNRIQLRNKRRNHKRFETTTLNPTLKLLSPAWAANVAMHNVMESFDDGVSDVISTLSNIDYTFMLNEYDEYGDEYDEDSGAAAQLQYVNINPYQSMHLQTFSVVDPLTILDDKMLSDLKERHDFKLEPYEIELKENLIVILREMDVYGEGRLDMADFASACMNIVSGYDDVMEDAMLFFETMQNLQDDMGTIKIVDIVDALILNDDDEAARNIKQEIVVGMNLNGREGDKFKEVKSSDNEIGIGTIEDMTELNVKEMEIDPNQQPYKPIYAVTNGRQKI